MIRDTINELGDKWTPKELNLAGFKADLKGEISDLFSQQKDSFDKGLEDALQPLDLMIIGLEAEEEEPCFLEHECREWGVSTKSGGLRPCFLGRGHYDP